MAEESREQQYAKLAYEAQLLQGQFQEVQRQLQQAAMINNELNSTIAALGSLKDVNGETFFQLGSGAFAKGSLSQQKTLLLDMGAGVFLEKRPEEAKEILQKRKENIEKALKLLNDNANQISRRLQEIEQLAEGLQ